VETTVRPSDPVRRRSAQCGRRPRCLHPRRPLDHRCLPRPPRSQLAAASGSAGAARRSPAALPAAALPSAPASRHEKPHQPQLQPPLSHLPRRARARDPARLWRGSPTRDLQPRRWCTSHQQSPIRMQETKAGELLRGEGPGCPERAGSPNPATRLRPSLQLRPQTQLSYPRAEPPTLPSHIPDLARTAYLGCCGWPEAARNLGSKLPGGRRRARHQQAERLRHRPQAHCRSRVAPRACWWRCCCGPPGPGHSAYWMGCATAAAVGLGPAPGSAVGQRWGHRDPGLEGGVGPAEEVRQGEREGSAKSARPGKVEHVVGA